MNPWSSGGAGIERVCYDFLSSDIGASEVYLQVVAICKGPRKRAEEGCKGGVCILSWRSSYHF